MTTVSFKTRYCVGEVAKSEDTTYDVVVKGTMLDVVPSGEVHYMAANPCDRRASFSGSGLPFHCAEQAFDETPNKGVVKLRGNYFEVPILFPNSYYVQLGRQLIPPTLFLMYDNANGDEHIVRIKLGDPVPYRFLEYPSQFTLGRNDATFYHAHHNLPVRGQEQLLKDSAYPNKNKMDADFWGLKPAL